MGLLSHLFHIGHACSKIVPFKHVYLMSKIPPLASEREPGGMQVLPPLWEETLHIVSSLVVAMPSTATLTISLYTSDMQSVV